MTKVTTDQPRQVHGEVARFLLSGAFNTLVTYIFYLVLIQFLPYRTSYTIVFIAGILLAYCLSRFFVFRVKGNLSAIPLFPAIYLIQYFIGLGVISLWIEIFGWNEALAPLAAIALTTPVIFILTRWVFSKKAPSS